MKYLVAVHSNKDGYNEIYEFDSEQERESFIQEVLALTGFDIATTEIEDCSMVLDRGKE